MKTIVTKIRVPAPKREGHFQYQPRKAKEVFDELQTVLRDADLLPDDYFSLARDFVYGPYKEADFPEISDLKCSASYGSNEGICLDVVIVTYQKEKKQYESIPFVYGKTLGESEQDYDRMQFIAGYIYRLFMDNGVHARYIIVPSGEPKKDHAALLMRINDEFTELMKQKLYAGRYEPQKFAEELALKAMIFMVLTRCELPAEKIAELLAMEKILEGLQKLCEDIMPANQFEIEDILASCRSFQIPVEEKA